VVGSAGPPGEPSIGEPSVGEPSVEASLGHAVSEDCARLGARVSSYVRDPAGGEAAMDAAVVDASSSSSSSSFASSSASSSNPGGIDMLVVDGAALFASGDLRACLDGAWNATRAVVNLAFLPAGHGGRIVYLAPPPGVGEQADAARAGLENLARTLSVEWARHGITLVTIALGDATTPGEAGTLTAYLASPAGAYFSGCLLDLRGV
jgi:NAD(P)-dependent dehydrogenase (short-subunit alcohol dehydrogenase family)